MSHHGRNKYNLNTKWSQSGIKQSKTKGDTGTGDQGWICAGCRLAGNGMVMGKLSMDSQQNLLDGGPERLIGPVFTCRSLKERVFTFSSLIVGLPMPTNPVGLGQLLLFSRLDEPILQ